MAGEGEEIDTGEGKKEGDFEILDTAGSELREEVTASKKVVPGECEPYCLREDISRVVLLWNDKAYLRSARFNLIRPV